MSVTGISNLPQIITPPQRGGSAVREPARTIDDRQGDEGARSTGKTVGSDNPAGSLPSDSFRQQVLLSRQVPQQSTGRGNEEQPLSFTAQRALKAFAENTPSPGQQLGIELAGVDTYA